MQYGDLYQLGNHFLLIGDSTNPNDLHRLKRVAGQAHAIITDPPYGIIAAKWDKANYTFIQHLATIARPNTTAIIFCALPYGFKLHEEMQHNGWTWRFNFIWLKSGAGFQISKQMPLPKHEHMFGYCYKEIPASQLTFNGYDAGEQGEPWGDRHDKAAWSREVYKNRKRMERKGRADGKRWITTILPGRKKLHLPTALRTEHPTQKPPELLERLVKLISHPGEIIFDGFAGSGSTLLACEATGRCCIAIEKNPAYAEIIIQQWQKQTGQEAQRCRENGV